MKRLTCLILLASVAGCATPTNHPDIQSVLDQQTTAWNAGDLDAYMQTYWRSDELVFSTSTGDTKGWNETLARYKKSYPTQEAMGRLRFDEIEITRTNDTEAAASGRFILTSKKGEETGRFYLKLRRIDDAWVIIHDYTVAD